MFIRFTLLTICLVIATCSLAQPERRTLDWKDFTKSISETIIARPVRTGEFTIFEITNINKFLYKVEMEGRVFELQTPIPTELQTLFRLNPTELAKTANNEKSAEAAGIIKKEIDNMNMAKDVATAAAADARANALAKVGDVKAMTEKKAAEDFEKAMEELVKNCTEYYDRSTQISKYVFELRKVRNEYVSIAQMDLPSAQIRAKAADVSIPSANVKDEYFALKNLYHKVERQYNDALAKAVKAGATEEEKQLIKDALENIEEADKLIDEEGLLGLLTEVDFLGAELQNPKNFMAVSPPVQMDGDFVGYEVTITPTTTKTPGAFKNPINFKFDIPAKGGWKADFSVGPVVSFGDNAKDETYFVKEVTGQDSVTLEKQDNNNAISPGIAAMMHFYPRTGKNWAVGGLFGVGAGFQSVSDVNFSLYAGASVVLGKRQKIMLNTGVSYLRVERLKSPEFKAGSKYETARIVIGDVTEKVFKPSFFLSISYNLTNRVEIK